MPRRHVREGPLGPEEGDRDELLEREARADDLAEHSADRRPGKRAGPLRLEAREERGLALGIVQRDDPGGALDLPNFLGDPRALGEQVEELVVEGVDLLPLIFEVHDFGRARIAAPRRAARRRRAYATPCDQGT